MGDSRRGRLGRLASLGVATGLCLALSSGTSALAAAGPGAGGPARTHAPKDPKTPSGPGTTGAQPAQTAQTAQTAPDPVKLAIADAIATAKKTHKTVPIPEATTAYATLVADPDGTVSANSHVNPQRAKVDGKWAPIDTTLSVKADGRLHTKATVAAITLSDGGSAPLAVTDDGAGHVLTLTWPGTLPKPTVSGAVATYHAVYPGVDLQVTASATGITHLLVVHDAAAAANPALSSVQIGETGTGVAISATPAGGVQAVAADGTKVFTGQEPHMWDSAGKASGPPGSSKAAAPAVADGGPHTAALPAQVANGKITLQPDQNLLRGASTVYPVYIDPAWVENPQNWVEMDSANQRVWDGQAPYPWGTPSQPYDNSVVRVGNSGGTVFRSLLQFNADILTPNNYTNFLVVSDAWLYLTFQSSCVTTDVWASGPFNSGINWGNQDIGGATGYSVWSGGHVIGTNNCSANPWNPVAIADVDQVRQVFAGGGHTFSVGLRAHNEAAGGGYGGIQVLNNGLIYDANITVKFVAEPWFENVGATGVAAPVGNHGATQKICGADENSAGYLPMTSGAATFTANLADWDSASVDYHFWLYDKTYFQGNQDAGVSNVTTVPYSQAQTPGSRTGGATVPLSASFPTTTQPITTFGKLSTPTILDGDLYFMSVQANDTNPTVDNAFLAARNVEGNNLEYPFISCYFHAALSAPIQPDFPANAGTTFVSTGTHLTGNYPVVGDGGNIVVHSSAEHTPIVRFDWALNTSSTNAGANNCGGVINASCGSVAGNDSLDSTATITIGGGPGTQALGTGEHWGNNYVYVSAIDAAGNVSAAGRFDFFLAQPFQPVSFGNVTGDGTPNLMKADTAGNLDIYPANQDMDPNAADAVEVAPAAAAPNGTSWKNALYTHRGAERVQPTDDLFAWDIGSDNNGHLYYYFNAQTASASTQPGYVPPARLDAFTQTQKSAVTRPVCSPAATNGWCAGYNQSNWNDVKKILAVGPVLGGCNIKAPTTACKTNLITIESDGHSPARMWMFSPAGVGQLRNPVLLSTSTPASAAGPGWDWSTVRFLMAPGNAAGHPAPAGAPAAGGLPDLWAVDSTGTLYQFTNHSDTGLAGAGLGDLTAKTRLGTVGQFDNYDWVSSAGDLDGDGNPDLWVINGGRMDVLFGPIGANITDQNTDPMSGTGTKPTQAQSTATTSGWASADTTLQGDVIGGGLAGQVLLPGVVGGTAPGQKCLDDLNGSLADGTTVIDVYDCNGTTPQQWTFAADGTIRPMGADPANPKCLDTGGSLIQGQLVTLYSCGAPKRFQTWRTIPSPSSPGLYWIYNPQSGMCLDDSHGSANNSNPFWLWPCIDSIAQRYQLPKAAGATQQVEAESLWGSQSGASPTPQGNCCGISLSNGYQSYFPATAAHASITYNWYVPAAGTYIVEPALTKTNDRGQYTLTVDSTQLPTTFDGYQASGVSLVTVPFGKISLTAGMHSFTFTASGTNAASVGNRYVLGVDTLALAPTTTTGPTVALNVSAPGIVNQPVTADASASFPGTARIAGYTFDFGDGTVVGPQTGPTAQHVYTATGSYQVKVTVTDSNNGSSTSNTAAVVLSSAPVVNGDFETGSLAGWSASYNSGMTTSNPHHGTYAGQLNAPTGGSASIEQVVTGLAPNTSYTLTGWIRTDGGSTILGTKQYDAADDDTGARTTATSWTQLSNTFTTGPANTSVDIYCYRSTAGTSACDDYTLVATPAAAAVANPDFETGNLAGWTAAYNSGVTTSNVHGGTYAGQINAPTGGNGSIEQVVTGLLPNTSYTLTGWIRTDGGTTILGTKQYDAADDDTGARTTASTWTQLSNAFTTGPTNTSVDIYCYRSTAGTSACDDFSLARTPATVANPDFETGGLDGWSASYNAGVTTTNPHGGTYAGQINAPTGGHAAIEQVVGGLTPNTTYTLTGWVRTDGGATILGVKQYDSAGGVGDSITSATGWTQLSDQFTTDATGTSVDIYCYRNTAGISACDDISLTQN